MSRTTHRKAWMGYLTEASESDFAPRFAALLRLWVHGLPSQSPVAGYLPWHLASKWQDWVLAPLSTIPIPDILAPVTLPENLLQPFDDADPWRQSAPLAELFLAVQRRRLPVTERRTRGLVFTPRPVADALVQQLDPVVTPPLAEPLRILDPAAGGGMFWEALIGQRLADVEPHARPAMYADLILMHLYALERDPLLAALIDVRARAGWYCLQLLTSGLTASELPAPPDALNPQIVCTDTLDRYAWPDAWPAQFDVVIGNPPYGYAEAIPLEEQQRLAQEYDVARGPFDRSWVFIERGIKLLTSGGVLAYLIPDALMVRPRARRLRELIARTTTILSTSSVGTIFPHAGVGGAFLLARKRSRPRELIPGESQEVVDSLFRTHLQPTVDAGSRGVRLGDLCTISRGEELGDKACRPLRETSMLIPILRGRDLSMLGHPWPQVGIVSSLRKPAVIYETPKIMVVKTGTTPIIAVDLFEGVATLQSIYNVHLRSDAPEGIALPLIAWLMACEAGQAQFRQFTAGKTLFPQLNQHMLESFVLPPLEQMREWSKEMETLRVAVHFGNTGVLSPQERAELIALTG